MIHSTCSVCGASTQPRARFCAACGRALPVRAARSTPLIVPPPIQSSDIAVEATLPSPKHISVQGDTFDLREVVNVVESGVRWWQANLTSADAATRAQAARSIEELSRILHSLSQQLAQGRQTVQITTRLPVVRSYVLGCPACGRGNREHAKFCQYCGTALSGLMRQEAEKAMPLRFSIAARTDTGRVRKINQDCVYTGVLRLSDGTQAQLCLVADGMGGAKAGEQASRIATEVTRTQIQTDVYARMPQDDEAWQMILRQAARAANRQVYEESRGDADRQGMGTTLTMVVIVGKRMHVASVGDSRAYLLNADGVTDEGATMAQLTADHSLVARLVDIGQITAEQARVHPQRNILYRSIGTDPAIEVDTRSDQLGPGDVMVLCSDGLFNHVRDEEIAQMVLEQSDPDVACERLVALANERGGRDNISVVIIVVRTGSEK